jgi:anti-sigma B factor antagonist
VNMLVSQRAGWTVVELPEELDLHNAWDIRTELLRILHAGAVNLVLDLANTHFIDSSGLWAIAATNRRAGALDAELRLVVTRPIARRLLYLTGVDRTIVTFDTVEQATREPVAAPVSAAHAAGRREGITHRARPRSAAGRIRAR